MLAPKKGLLCNLNHIHLQHISLGLHLSRHPELQESSTSASPATDQTGCGDCPENHEQVDANSNNPSFKCRCCESHTQQPETLGLLNQAAQEGFPCLPAGEEAASPCDLASSTSSSSSVSSCSDFSLDDSPVSVYCKSFSREGSKSPENQPSIIPVEDAGDGRSSADPSGTCDGRDANLNPPALQRRGTPAGESPDSLCSSPLLTSQRNQTSPSLETTRSIPTDLDPNCNPLPEPDAAPAAPPAPVRWDRGLGSAPEPPPRAGSVPPPVPPRPRRRLQVLGVQRAEQPLVKPEPSPGELCRDAAKKNITSFHELAQKRKRNAGGAALAQARADRSDWLIVFSPDTELPPPSELLASEPARPQPQHDRPAKPPGSRHREVTTFKELRYRSAANKPKGPPAGGRAEPAAPPRPPATLGAAAGSDGAGWGSPAPRAPLENRQPKRRRSRPGLQPIAEGQPADTEEAPLPPPPRRVPGEKGPSAGGDGDVPVWRLGEPGGDPWVPGTVERGDDACKEARGRAGTSSAALSPGPGAALRSAAPSGSMGERGPAGPGSGSGSAGGRPARPEPPGAAAGTARPGGGSTEGEQKKALLVAVSAAVDKIIAHFSAARNLVQKAQLGDSRLSPDVGHLLLRTLCPALYAVVEDGLKPFQKDVITGQRRNSPWSVVEASVKTGRGSSTRSLHALCWHVAGLAPLSSTRQKFHAFILGLLNMKQLELWISHLQKSPGVISTLYSPLAFFALSQGPLPHLADELLLLLQPLSVLTFHLDLLFEHHHLSVDVRPLSRRLQSPASPPHHAVQPRGAAQPPPEPQSAETGDSLDDESPPDAVGRAAGAEGGTRVRSRAAERGLLPGPQVGAALQLSFQHVLRWGDQLSRALRGGDSSPEPPRPEAGPRDAGAGLGGWWDQLGQASRVYAAPSKEKLAAGWWAKLRAAAGDPSPGQAVRPHGAPTEARGTELQLLQSKAAPEPPAAKPSGSADTSGSSSPEDLALSAGAGAPAEPNGQTGGELKAASPEPRGNGNGAAADPERDGPAGPDKGSWLGRLFGATSPSARSFRPGPDTSSTRSRRPSSWLSPGAVKGLAAERTRDGERAERNAATAPQPHRAVRALCDHTGAADGHLSFQKGDILQLLSTVDEDWIRCCRGNCTGLVPVGYTSLIL